MSPELLLSGSNYTAKVDVYAYGMLVYEILFCEPPFADFEPDEVESAVLAGDRPDTGCDDVPAQLLRLMRACWHQDAARRPSFDTLVGALAAFSRGDEETFEALLAAVGDDE
jgi:serine/threonine protein kinase